MSDVPNKMELIELHVQSNETDCSLCEKFAL